MFAESLGGFLFFCCFILVLFFNVESIAGCRTTITVYGAVHITHASLVCVFKTKVFGLQCHLERRDGIKSLVCILCTRWSP